MKPRSSFNSVRFVITEGFLVITQDAILGWDQGPDVQIQKDVIEVFAVRTP
jgi:hypothetical protein